MNVIDVHTHMLNEEFLKLLRKVVGGQTGLVKDGAPFMSSEVRYSLASV